MALELRYVDLLRETGGDILWNDAGWYDKWGSWNGPDWRQVNEYLAKHGMKWALRYPTFLATPDSEIGQQHPEWLIPKQDVLEQSIKATADWQRQILDKSVQAWGDYQWRYDIAPALSDTDTGYLDSDQNFRGLAQGFKEAHKASGVDACFGGGLAGWPMEVACWWEWQILPRGGGATTTEVMIPELRRVGIVVLG